jgi:hypothetical protein
VDTKIASLNCHRTQINPTGPFSPLPQEVTRDIMRTDYYALVRPEAAGGRAPKRHFEIRDGLVQITAASDARRC